TTEGGTTGTGGGTGGSTTEGGTGGGTETEASAGDSGGSCTSVCDCSTAGSACIGGKCTTDYNSSPESCHGCRAMGKPCHKPDGSYDLCGGGADGAVDPCPAFDCASGALCPPDLCSMCMNDICAK